MISAITEAMPIMASDDIQPSKLLVILLSTVIFIAVSAVSASVTYKLKKKKYRESNDSSHKEQKNEL